MAGVGGAAGGARLAAWPFAYEPTPGSQTELRARQRLGILKVTLGKFGLARRRVECGKEIGPNNTRAFILKY